MMQTCSNVAAESVCHQVPSGRVSKDRSRAQLRKPDPLFPQRDVEAGDLQVHCCSQKLTVHFSPSLEEQDTDQRMFQSLIQSCIVLSAVFVMCHNSSSFSWTGFKLLYFSS
ncbi:uncharacterized protein V6R79_017863 [Siganus canaliculatus]